MPSLYDTDFFAWAQDVANKLRSGRLSDVDLELVAEEIESLGKSEQQQLSNRLVILIAHMLKWEFHPNQRKTSWQGTIREQRARITRLLKRNPSLKALVDETITEAYPVAVTLASSETDIVEEDFPRTCPYTRDEIVTG
jgi:hypothetical protein